jgi:hypothetical protein
MALGLLSPSPPAALPYAPPPRDLDLGSIELATVWLSAVAITVTPLAFILAAH